MYSQFLGFTDDFSTLELTRNKKAWFKLGAPTFNDIGLKQIIVDKFIVIAGDFHRSSLFRSVKRKIHYRRQPPQS